MSVDPRLGPPVSLIPESAPFTPAQRAWLNGFFAGLLTQGAPYHGAQPVAAPVQAKPPSTILFASQTGTAEGLAKKLVKAARQKGFAAEARDLGTLDLAAIAKLGHVALLASTYGEGEPPDGAKAFAATLEAASGQPLAGLRFAVLALGDRNYAKFCRFGAMLDMRFAELGATRLLNRVECDADVDAPFAEFRDAWLGALDTAPASAPAAAPNGAAPALADADEETETWSRARPFRAALLANERLNGPNSDKDTRHVALSLANSGLRYEPGDALGVCPENAPEAVAAVLEAAGLAPDVAVTLADGEITLGEALTHRFAIGKLAAPTVIKFQARAESAALARLLDPENTDLLNSYLWGRELIDLLTEYPGVISSADALIACLPKLAPRLYSISSSQRVHPDEVHVTVGVVRYESHGRRRAGVASSFLADRVGLAGRAGTAPVYVHRNPRFRLPEDPQRAIVMIGPGTGIAPFRAFLQERRAVGARGKAWLFFGDRRAADDFLYRRDLQGFRRDGTLTRLDAAFSRDQDEKIYVQHLMLEQSAELHRWIRDGAYVYVCGDATHMARDVDRALRAVVMTHGKLSEAKARLEVQGLAAEGRYLRDVY